MNGAGSPQEAQFPSSVKGSGFTVLDTNEGVIHLALGHGEGRQKFSDVYLSDYRGSQFTLSLMNVVRTLDGTVDFEKIEGMDGVYIANIYDKEAVEKKKTKGKTGRKSQQTNAVKRLENLDDFKKTMISFDYGSSWRYLKAPEFDGKGKPIHCSGECSLHLKGRSELRGTPIYSSENSPGIILATGNFGYYLDRKETQYTFLSRDGG